MSELFLITLVSIVAIVAVAIASPRSLKGASKVLDAIRKIISLFR